MGSLYIDCSLGVSGDMLVAALLDAGADSAALDRALSSLSVADEFEIAISTVTKAGMRACDFDVVLRHGHEIHDHDMAYLHGVVRTGAAARTSMRTRTMVITAASTPMRTGTPMATMTTSTSTPASIITSTVTCMTSWRSSTPRR